MLIVTLSEIKASEMHVHVFLKLFVKYLFVDAPLSLELKIFMIDQSLKLADDNNTKVVNKLFCVEFVGK